MGAGNETIFDICNDDNENKPLTDLEKFKKIFDERYISYEVTNNGTTIVIDDAHFYNSSCASDQRLTIEFDSEQNFQHFMTTYKPYN